MSETCSQCKRNDLPLLAVTHALVPIAANAGFADLRDGPLKPSATTVPALDAHTLTARLPRHGYIYLLFKTGRVDCYHLDGAGQPLYYPNEQLANVPNKPLEQTVAQRCSNEAAHKLARFLTIPNARQYDRAWLAYSRTRWTKLVREKMVAEAVAMKEFGQGRRLFCLDVQTALSGGVPKGTQIVSEELLTKYVADYSAESKQRALNAELDERDPLLNEHSQAATAAKSMKEIGETRAAKCLGLVVPLVDPIGLSRQAAHRRNKLHALIGEQVTDDAVKRKLMVSKTYRSLEKSALEAKSKAGNKNAEAYAKRWAEKYSTAVKLKGADGIEKFERDYKAKITALEAKLKAAAGDWVKLYDAQTLRSVLFKDYDDKDLRAGLDYVTEVAEITFGAGGTEIEGVQWAPHVASTVLADNIFLRAMLLNQAKLIAASNAAVGTKEWGGGGTDSSKNFLAAVEEWIKDIERANRQPGFFSWASYLQRAGVTTQQQISKLMVTAQSAAGILTDSERLVEAQLNLARVMGVDFGIAEVTMTARALEDQLRRTISGDEFVLKQFAREFDSTSKLLWKSDVTKLQATAMVGDDRPMKVRVLVLKKVQSPNGTWRSVNDEAVLRGSADFAEFDARRSLNEILSRTFEQKFSARWGPQLTTRGPSPTVIEAAGALFDYGRVNIIKLANSSAGLAIKYLPGPLAIIVGGFQLWNIQSNWSELVAAKTPTKQTQAGIGLTAGVLGVLGAYLDLSAVLLGVKAARGGATALAAASAGISTRVMWGGIFGGVSGVAVGVLKLAQQGELRASGDIDAADLSIAVGFVAILAGGTGVGMGAAVGLGGSALLIPVVGWAIAFGILTVLALAGEFWIADAKDDVLEAWLKHSTFGVSTDTTWTKDVELAEYGKIMALWWRFESDGWSDGGMLNRGQHGLKFKVEVPVVSTAMRLEVHVKLIDHLARLHYFTFTMEPMKQIAATQPGDWKQFARDHGVRLVHLNEVQSSENLALQVEMSAPSIRNSLNRDVPVIKAVTVQQLLWPDRKLQPSVKLPGENGKVDQFRAPN